ncbi:hypothetical protein AAG906_032461 [Vitis piasezkii]
MSVPGCPNISAMCLAVTPPWRAGKSSRPQIKLLISNFSEQWLIMVGMTILVCGFLAYVIYDAVVVTAADLLHLLAVHWLSTVPPANRLNFPMPGSEPNAIHRAGASPWGLAVVLLLLFFLISYQPSLHGLIF